MKTSEAKLFDNLNIDELFWPDSAQARDAQRILTPVIKNGPSRYINNVSSPVGIILVNNKVLPVVIETAGHDSHVASLYGHFITAACEEGRKFRNAVLGNCSQFMVSTLGRSFFGGILPKNVQVDNWLVTTNLHCAINADDVRAVTDYFKSCQPDRAIVFRSLTEYTDAELMRALRQNHYHFIASRQVYFWDYRRPARFSLKARHALRKDDALAQEAGYGWSELDFGSRQDLFRVLDLYRHLYLEKYSYHNPQYSEHFLKELCADPAGFLRIKVLVKNRNIDGFFGYYIRQGIMTAPFVGYDTGLPQKIGLYRMVMSKIRQEARELGLVLNGSAGAGEFKRTRGGISTTEYFAVYDRHLKWPYRSNWSLLRLTMDTFGKAVLRSNIL